MKLFPFLIFANHLLCSPTKSEFIRAKYQMLAFVHKLPCRDDDGVTTKDLSKVKSDDFPGNKLHMSLIFRRLWV